MSPDPTAEQEDAWIQKEREKVIQYLQRGGVAYREVGEYPAFHIWPYLAIWAIESRKFPGSIGWWAISGDAPTDYMTRAGTVHPREAMAYFGKQWSEVADFMFRGEEHPTISIGAKEDWPTLAPLLKTRSGLLAKYSTDDSIWDHDEDA